MSMLSMIYDSEITTAKTGTSGGNSLSRMNKETEEQ